MQLKETTNTFLISVALEYRVPTVHEILSYVHMPVAQGQRTVSVLRIYLPYLQCLHSLVFFPAIRFGYQYIRATLTQKYGKFKSRDLTRFTTDVSCGVTYLVTLTLPINYPRISLLLVVKSDRKVFVRDFFGDPQSDGNPALFVIDFSLHRLRKINDGNDAGVTNLVEANGTVRVFGSIASEDARCRLFLGVLPKFYDLTRCEDEELCGRDKTKCGFCGRNVNWEEDTKTSGGGFVDIKVNTLVTECLFWDEKVEMWSNQGCKVRLCMCWCMCVHAYVRTLTRVCMHTCIYVCTFITWVTRCHRRYT